MLTARAWRTVELACYSLLVLLGMAVAATYLAVLTGLQTQQPPPTTGAALGILVSLLAAHAATTSLLR